MNRRSALVLPVILAVLWAVPLAAAQDAPGPLDQISRVVKAGALTPLQAAEMLSETLAGYPGGASAEGLSGTVADILDQAGRLSPGADAVSQTAMPPHPWPQAISLLVTVGDGLTGPKISEMLAVYDSLRASLSAAGREGVLDRIEPRLTVEFPVPPAGTGVLTRTLVSAGLYRAMASRGIALRAAYSGLFVEIPPGAVDGALIDRAGGDATLDLQVSAVTGKWAREASVRPLESAPAGARTLPVGVNVNLGLDVRSPSPTNQGVLELSHPIRVTVPLDWTGGGAAGGGLAAYWFGIDSPEGVYTGGAPTPDGAGFAFWAPDPGLVVLGGPGHIGLRLNGGPVAADVPPVMVNAGPGGSGGAGAVEADPAWSGLPPGAGGGRVLVPLRGLFEAMGARVEWIPAEGRVDVMNGDTAITLWPGRAVAVVGRVAPGSKAGLAPEREVPLDAFPVIVRGRLMVPIRFVSEALGATVSWDETLRLVDVTTEVGAR